MFQPFLAISAVPDLTNALVCMLCFYRLNKTWNATKQTDLRTDYFRKTYFILVLTYLAYSLPVLFFSTSTDILSAAYIIGNGGFFLALASFVRIPLSFKWQHLQRPLFYGLIGVGLVFVIIGFLFPPQPEVNYFTRIVRWNPAFFVDVLYGLYLAIALIPSMIFFVIQSWMSENWNVKVRSCLMGVGLMFLIVSAFIFYFFNFSSEFIVSNFFSVVGFLVLLSGVYYRQSSNLDFRANEM